MDAIRSRKVRKILTLEARAGKLEARHEQMLARVAPITAVRSLVEPLQVAMDNGAKRALVTVENKRQFLEVNPDVLEHVDPIFYGDLRQAAFKALGLN